MHSELQNTLQHYTLYISILYLSSVYCYYPLNTAIDLCLLDSENEHSIDVTKGDEAI